MSVVRIPTQDKNVVRGVRTCNPGNIERVSGTRWQGELPVQQQVLYDPRFVVFSGPEWGIRAIARTLITYQDKRRAKDGSRIDTIKEIIDRWAPPIENDTSTYANNVAKLTGVGVDESIDVYRWEIMKPLVKAIIHYECAGYEYPDDIIDNGLIKAGLAPPATVVATGTTNTASTVGSVAAGVSVIVGALPAAKESYEQAVANSDFLVVIAEWLPMVLGLIAAGAILVLAARNIQLRKRLE